MTTFDIARQGMPAPRDDEPEHRNNRRRFLIWACMAGLVQPERVSEQILQELEQEAHG